METNKIKVPYNKKQVTFKNCKDTLHETIEGCLDDSGRILAVDVKLCHVLCNKTIAVGVLVFEDGIFRSFKVRKVYTGQSRCCRFKNISIDKFYFVFPDNEICKERNFKVKIISNYIN